MKPLEEVTVVDLSRVLAGPHCSMVMADLGAEVIKVEIPDGGDDSRGFGPFVAGQSGYFMSLNRNKKSVTIDLKTERGRAQLSQLLSRADVLLENFRPGTLDRLGFPWERLQRINARLICCRISGFGQTGPYRDWPAYDIIVQGMGGIMSITGQSDGPPTRVGASIGDIAAALYATIGILAALRVRDQTGQGQEVDVSMLDCQVAILENAVMRSFVDGSSPQRIGNRHPSITPFTSVRTKDGYINIAAGNDALWQRLCDLLGDADLAHSPRFASNKDRTENWSELEPILEGHFSTRSSTQWLELLRERGIPCGPINDVAAVVADPQVRARNMIWEINLGGSKIGFSGNPIKLSLTPADEMYRQPPKLGEHNDEVLAE